MGLVEEEDERLDYLGGGEGRGGERAELVDVISGDFGHGLLCGGEDGFNLAELDLDICSKELGFVPLDFALLVVLVVVFDHLLVDLFIRFVVLPKHLHSLPNLSHLLVQSL